MKDENIKMLLDFVHACADRDLSSWGWPLRSVEAEFDQIVNGARLIVWGLNNPEGVASVD